MILTATFHTPAAAADHFNAPANALLRLVNLLPPVHGGTDYTAIYEEAEDPLDALRLPLLEERVLLLLDLDDERKLGLGFSRSILDAPVVPVSIINNKLRHLALFKAMSNGQRAAWIRANVAAVGCACVPPDEARQSYGCGAELIRVEA